MHYINEKRKKKKKKRNKNKNNYMHSHSLKLENLSNHKQLETRVLIESHFRESHWKCLQWIFSIQHLIIELNWNLKRDYGIWNMKTSTFEFECKLKHRENKEMKDVIEVTRPLQTACMHIWKTFSWIVQDMQWKV